MVEGFIWMHPRTCLLASYCKFTHPDLHCSPNCQPGFLEDTDVMISSQQDTTYAFPCG